ncbi:MAG: LEA type 2 family protein [Candidatus Margulisiibacteriota bacterium]
MSCKKLIAAALLACGLFLLTSCVELKSPTVEYLGHEVTNIDLQKAELRFDFMVDNPNPVTIDHATYDYKLFVNEQELISGEDAPLKLPASGAIKVSIPVTLEYARVFNTAQALMNSILQGKTSTPYRLTGKFTFSALGMSIDNPFETSGDIPLPQLSDIRL